MKKKIAMFIATLSLVVMAGTAVASHSSVTASQQPPDPSPVYSTI